MIIQCNSCKARFKVPDDKISPEGTSVRCSRCKNVFKAFKDDPSRQKTEVAFDPAVANTAQAAEPDAAPPVQQNATPEASSFEFVMANSDEGGNLADSLGESSAPSMAPTPSEESDVAPPGEDDSLEDIFAMPEENSAAQAPAAEQVAQAPSAEESFSMDEWADGFSDEVSSSRNPEPAAQHENTATESGLDLEEDDPFAAVSSAPEAAVQTPPPRPEAEQSKAAKAPEKKRSHVHKTSPSKEFKARQASHEENKIATILVNAILAAVSIIVFIVAFSYRGVDLWKEGQRFWFFEEGFASKVDGPVIVKYQGFDLKREDGDSFFVIEGVLLNRSPEEIPAPQIRSLLTSDADLGIQESAELPCCLDVDVTALREIQSTLDVELLYSERANQEPLKADEWRKFLLVLEPENAPIFYKAIVAAN